MGTRLKALAAGIGILLAIVAAAWSLSGLPSFADWLADASEAEASFWGAIVGALSSGLIAVTILAADLDHRERQNIARRLSLARALKAEIADTISGLLTSLKNLDYVSRARGAPVPTTRIILIYEKRPLIAAPPEAIYELGEEVGRLFARLRTMFIKIEFNSHDDVYDPEAGAPLLVASIEDATETGCALLALIDQVDGEANDLSAAQWRDYLEAQASESFERAQEVRARTGVAAAV